MMTGARIARKGRISDRRTPLPTKYRRPVKRSPKSDPQQYRLYRIENELIGARSYLRLSREDLRRYIRALTRTFKTPPVKVVFEDIGKWAAEWREPNIIVFGKKTTSRDLLTAAHEFAHHLHGHLIGDRPQPNHGKEFMGCYMLVLDVSRFIPIIGMRAICTKAKLEFVDPGETCNVKRFQRMICK
jgi:hypothetical protein